MKFAKIEIVHHRTRSGFTVFGQQGSGVSNYPRRRLRSERDQRRDLPSWGAVFDALPSRIATITDAVGTALMHARNTP